MTDKVDSVTFGSTRAAHSLTSALIAYNDIVVTRRVGEKFHSFSVKLKAIAGSNLDMKLKVWAILKARDDFKRSATYVKDPAIRSHLLNVGATLMKRTLEKLK